jgi:hypothetical protein
VRVAIYPEGRAVEIRGTFRMVNGRAEPIDSTHLTTSAENAETRELTFDRTAALMVDEEHGYRIYTLEPVLAGIDPYHLFDWEGAMKTTISMMRNS